VFCAVAPHDDAFTEPERPDPSTRSLVRPTRCTGDAPSSRAANQRSAAAVIILSVESVEQRRDRPASQVIDPGRRGRLGEVSGLQVVADLGVVVAFERVDQQRGYF
jgi:hypothetical protein